jgi:hypothetical protein
MWITGNYVPQSLKTPAFGTTAALLTKRFLAVDGTPLGGAHAYAPQLFSQHFHTLMFLRGPDFLSGNAASIACCLLVAQRGAR